jgi:hypothetical protein
MNTDNRTGDHEELDPRLHAALSAHNAPPAPPLDEMWKQIERAHFGATVHTLPARRRLAPLWLATAAALVLGVAIGHFGPSFRPDVQAPPQTQVAKVEKPPVEVKTHSLVSPVTGRTGFSMPVETPYELTANRYLGQTAALLTVLPGAAGVGKQGVAPQVNAHFAEQATALLSTTRLLLNSPAGEDPALQALLPDLELVLAQVASLSSVRTSEELKLITEAVKQHDVLPRLQQAVLRTAKAGVVPDEGLDVNRDKDSLANSL